MTSQRGCHHLPPNWRWEGDTYRGTRTAVRFADRDEVDTLTYLLEHGTTAGLVHSEEYLRRVREEHAWFVERPCAYGYCTDQFCPICGAWKGGWGPVGCPCEARRSKSARPDQWPARYHAPVVTKGGVKRHRRRNRR